MASAAADIFRQAAELNRADPRREGNLVRIDADSDLLVAGDFHGHRRNLAKVISAAGLGGRQSRRLVLQEIIHGPADPRTGYDRSVELLLRAARLKTQQPEQVLFVLGNHDLAQATGNEITRAGRGACKAFSQGVRLAFGHGAEAVSQAVNEFLLSLPMAIRCPGGALIAHSLPAPSRMPPAGIDILTRPFGPDDLRRGGAVYEWTWGRGQTAEQIDQLAEQLDVTFFVLGHRHVSAGWEQTAPRALTLASDHDHGYVLQFPGDAALSAETVERYLRPIAALEA